MADPDRLRAFVATRNSEWTTDAALQGGLGLVFSVVTFGGCWWVTWLVFADWSAGLFAPVPLAITALFVVVATASAWRGVDPYANLAPLTEGEANRRQIERAVSALAGPSGAGIARREGIAGCANWLIAGPKGILDGLRHASKRVDPDDATLAEAQRILDASVAAPCPLPEDPQPALLLVHLGLARLDLDPAAGAVLSPTSKGKRVAGG